jgi:hypothetical protein
MKLDALTQYLLEAGGLTRALASYPISARVSGVRAAQRLAKKRRNRRKHEAHS